MEEANYLGAFLSSAHRDSVILAPPASLVSQGKIHGYRPWGPRFWGGEGGWQAPWLAGEAYAKERTFKALSWPCALALDFFFVFLNHTVPWVKGVQPMIVWSIRAPGRKG